MNRPPCLRSRLALATAFAISIDLDQGSHVARPACRQAGRLNVSTPRSQVRLLLIRHGESEWNREQRFTGWADVGLTLRGMHQMQEAGRAIRQSGLVVDRVFSSVLVRCVSSVDVFLLTAECPSITRTADWRLNERHYGALTGSSKAEAIARYGADQVQAWRRSYHAVPPPWTQDDVGRLAIDPLMDSSMGPQYAGLELPPLAESLAQTVLRVTALWQELIEPALASDQTVAVVGHGNSLRALVMQLERLGEEAVSHLEIANGEMRAYESGAGRELHLKCIWRPSVVAPISKIL
ncbi:MAG: 2,3-bisphosphoglycerate-dependent phosphoglycerate mutase [Pseudomonas sp.]|nr:MAG: 2,3-bisphosphoglycerate-dependent phosphoglycerate mutase [Pseudomonas sp.]